MEVSVYKSHASVTCVLFFAAIAVGGQVIAQQRPRVPEDLPAPPQTTAPSSLTAVGKSREVAISIRDSRPLSKAADALQLELGVPISYEDPAWVSSDDLIESGKFPDARNQNLKDLSKVGPALGTLDLRFEVDTVTGVPTRSVEGLLQEVLATHLSRNNPGEFKVVSLGKGEGFSIVPNRIKNASRSVVSTTPLFDVRISLDEKERSVYETLDEITKAIYSASGKDIVTVIVPKFQNNVTFGAKDEVARDVLAKFLHMVMMPTKGSWKLYYDANGGFYTLSILQVSHFVTRQGIKESYPVLWSDRTSE